MVSQGYQRAANRCSTQPPQLAMSVTFFSSSPFRAFAPILRVSERVTGASDGGVDE